MSSALLSPNPALHKICVIYVSSWPLKKCFSILPYSIPSHVMLMSFWRDSLAKQHTLILWFFWWEGKYLLPFSFSIFLWSNIISKEIKADYECHSFDLEGEGDKKNREEKRNLLLRRGSHTKPFNFILEIAGKNGNLREKPLFSFHSNLTSYRGKKCNSNNRPRLSMQ